ncbi:hypothetical protein [Kitasatospora sp. NPDC059571]|uniref:hypothetical protein n=1 Tax=Kitasatospora sp. NPDC059571 TaxID=3346871 RepID=UPI0036C4F124
MPIFGRRRSTAPRLAPELDDQELGRVCRQLTAPRMQGQLDLSAGLVEQVLRGAGGDWDRRTHRLGVLARLASPALATVWRRQRPRDADPLVLHAWIDVAEARVAGALEDPRATLDRCRRAADLRPEDPAPWVALLAVHRLLRRPEQEVYPICREIGARDAWNRTAHLEMLRYLSPDECGSHLQALDFVEAVRASAPAGTAVAGLELALLTDRYRAGLAQGGVTALGARRRWALPDAEAALGRAMADWPTPGFLRHAAALADLNLLAYALGQAGRVAEAGPVFAALDGVVTPWPWGLDGDPVDEFARWRDQAPVEGD